MYGRKLVQRKTGKGWDNASEKGNTRQFREIIEDIPVGGILPFTFLQERRSRHCQHRRIRCDGKEKQAREARQAVIMSTNQKYQGQGKFSCEKDTPAFAVPFFAAVSGDGVQEFDNEIVAIIVRTDEWNVVACHRLEASWPDFSPQQRLTCSRSRAPDIKGMTSAGPRKFRRCGNGRGADGSARMMPPQELENDFSDACCRKKEDTIEGTVPTAVDADNPK
ncbi:hypothetical protein B0H19DRAFT_1059861 [Mycena capillaripes]|nr:hypothetical protein B0H19DRAFT_1059861 [Mycena capillaripes]